MGPSVLDSTDMPRWVRRVERSAKHRVRIWALHNYIDANRFRTSGTRSLLNATRKTKAKIWSTETGGLVRRDNGSRIEFADSKTHAAKATRQVEKLARLSRRVQRVFFYHWVAPDAGTTWDSALSIAAAARGRPTRSSRPTFAAPARRTASWRRGGPK